MEPGDRVCLPQHLPLCEPTGRAPRASSSTARSCERLISGWCSRESFPAPRASELGELEHDELTMGTPESLARRGERKR